MKYNGTHNKLTNLKVIIDNRYNAKYILGYWILIVFFFHFPYANALEQSDLVDNETLVTSDETNDEIQQKIDTANGGQTLVFDVGSYTLNLNLSNNVNLRGVETANVILKSDGENPIIQVNNAVKSTIQNFTFSDASIAIDISATDSLLITNNIFRVGNSNIAININEFPDVSIINNTFYDLETAILVSQNLSSHIIRNNIFSKFDNLFFNVLIGDVSFNCFDRSVANYSDARNNKVINDIGFVDIEKNDFHLLESSECIDNGEGSLDADGSQTDMGAYGGAGADKVPFPVSGVNVVENGGDSNVKISWQKNKDYRISGYKVYYDKDTIKGLSSSAVENLSSTQVSSNVTTVDIFNLDTDLTTPEAPVLKSVKPGNTKLLVSWDKVSNANSYAIFYQLEGESENSINVSNVDNYEITNLINGKTYTVWLQAVNEFRYNFQVVGLIDSDGEITEGLFLNEDVEYTNNLKQTSSNSNTIVGLPEAVVPYPALPNEGCFIATAAFGYYSHQQVQVLRDFRDNYLLKSAVGRDFVEWYYTFGTYAAAFISKHDYLKPLVRVLLYPLILASQALTYHAALFWGLILNYLFLSFILLKQCGRFMFGRLIKGL